MTYLEGEVLAPPPVPHRKFPVIATFHRAYEILLRDYRAIIMIGILPMLLLGVDQAMLEKFVLGKKPEDIVEAAKTLPVNDLLSVALPLFLGSFFLMAIRISWQRHLLLHENPNGFYTGRPLWRYLGFMILLNFGVVAFVSFVAVGAALLIAGLQASKTLALAVTVVAALAGAIFVIVQIMRHYLFLVSIAIDNRTFTLQNARDAMRGNVWRFIGAGILCQLPIMIGGSMLHTVIEELGGKTPNIELLLVAGLIQGAAAVLETVTGATVLALAWDFMVNGGGPAHTETRQSVA